ncbi:MAG: phosphatase PAP2 family protein [Thermoleophilia bacterium]
MRFPAIRSSSDRITAKGVFGELLFLGVALGVYFVVRCLVRDVGTQPLDNAAALLRLEASLHLNWEVPLQRAFLHRSELLIHVLNFIYAWGYWLILIGSLSYLYVRFHEFYRGLRNAMIVSGVIGVFIFASFPVAPPRLAAMGIFDTVKMASSVLEEVARPSGIVNENAAMPSFHFGWVLLCSICLSMVFKRQSSKILVLALPLVMGLTIIVTGNHYVVDAIVGGAISLFALTPWALRRRHSVQEEPKPLLTRRVCEPRGPS